ncbi:MAG: hypothetical protein ACR2ND_07775 [Solirubrobacteraceae bacterium]
MSLSVQIGLLFALATAMASIVGFLYKHRGAVASPPVTLRAPISSSLALLRSRWYVLGILIAIGGWGLHVVALALAPISLVQSVIAGGLVFLTVAADRLFGLQVSRREWLGVVACAVGLSFLAATLSGVGRDSASHYADPTLWRFTIGAAVAGVLLAAASRRLNQATALALSAGLLWGASDVSIKALSGQLGANGVGVLLTPLALAILALSLVGFSISGRSLQIGEPVAVIAATSAAANLVTISAGPAVFGEPLPSGTLALGVHVVAFALVVIAAALTPPPVRALSVP